MATPSYASSSLPMIFPCQHPYFLAPLLLASGAKATAVLPNNLCALAAALLARHMLNQAARAWLVQCARHKQQAPPQQHLPPLPLPLPQHNEPGSGPRKRAPCKPSLGKGNVCVGGGVGGSLGPRPSRASAAWQG
jgi:hypothetical protein